MAAAGAAEGQPLEARLAEVQAKADAEVLREEAAKYDPVAGAKATGWLAEVLGRAGDWRDSQEVAALAAAGRTEGGPQGPEVRDVQRALRDGRLLCRAANALKPGSVAKVSGGKSPFEMMANIGNFVGALEALGIPQQELFQTADLYDGQNIPKVVKTLLALGTLAQKLDLDGSYGVAGGAGKREAASARLKAGAEESQQADLAVEQQGKRGNAPMLRGDGASTVPPGGHGQHLESSGGTAAHTLAFSLALVAAISVVLLAHKSPCGRRRRGRPSGVGDSTTEAVAAGQEDLMEASPKALMS